MRSRLALGHGTSTVDSHIDRRVEWSWQLQVVSKEGRPYRSINLS